MMLFFDERERETDNHSFSLTFALWWVHFKVQSVTTDS